ncbi:MAG: hypothetical protein ACXQT2_00060 [Methanotrichaceae archaeon]
MITVEVRNQDMVAATAQGRTNLPGTLFGGSTPLLRPFLPRLEELLPPDERGRGSNYISSTLRVHVNIVRADEERLRLESGDRSVEITKSELESILEEKYPTFEHHKLNLPGLLFLQSGPALQACTLKKLNLDHGVKVPDGRRTQRYVFHTTVISIRADPEMIRIEFDLDRLPSVSDV